MNTLSFLSTNRPRLSFKRPHRPFEDKELGPTINVPVNGILLGNSTHKQKTVKYIETK